ncbi:12908_t:CDS:2, partial [Funneliformis mosseae]
TSHIKLSQQQLCFHSSPQRYASNAFLLKESGKYSLAHSTPPPPHIQKVFEKTQKEYPSEEHMMSPHLQGSLLTTLCKIMNASKVLELGCFTGYSALCLAEGIKDNKGKVISCEKDEKFAKFALQNVKESNMEDFIEIRVGDGLNTLQSIKRSTHFDLIFIDANKSGYVDYYETILDRDLLSSNGVIIADNVPHFDPNAPETSENHIPKPLYEMAKSLNRFNEHVTKDPRTTNVLIPGFDGLMFIRKNSECTQRFHAPSADLPLDQDLIFNESPLDQDSVLNKNLKTSHVISLGYNLYDINGFMNTPRIEKSSDLKIFIGDNDNQIIIEGNSKLLKEDSNLIIQLLLSIFKIQVDLSSNSSNVTVENSVTMILLRKFNK